MPTAVYIKLSEIFWVPPDNRHKGWMFEYYTGIMENEGRKRKNYRVIHRPTDLPDKDGRCTYGQLSKEVMALVYYFGLSKAVGKRQLETGVLSR